jgi:sterol desaturase/sphingolipid hydroxylase (fatty acid hydroxylase superfamily)
VSARLRAAALAVAYPLTVFGGTAAVAVALARGAPAAVAMFVLQGATALVVVALERAAPAEPAWRRARGDLRADLLHLFVSTLAVGGLFQALVLGPLAGWVARAYGGPWPGRWPLPAQLALALIASELGGYSAHRLLHRVPWLWRLHAVHHAAPRVYWLNGLRNHPGDVLLSLALAASPLVLLGAPADLLALFNAFVGAHLLWQHANVELRLGPLARVLNLGEVHRWHHARDLAESEANYGNVLLVWDWLLGSYVPSRPARAPADVGLADGSSFPSGYLGQLAAPFRR